MAPVKTTSPATGHDKKSIGVVCHVKWHVNCVKTVAEDLRFKSRQRKENCILLRFLKASMRDVYDK